jgi:hypothetical protein
MGASSGLYTHVGCPGDVQVVRGKGMQKDLPRFYDGLTSFHPSCALRETPSRHDFWCGPA